MQQPHPRGCSHVLYFLIFHVYLSLFRRVSRRWRLLTDKLLH
jgi:hypothetical protein